MKLDVTCMRYLTKDDFRILVAVEMGMRNHEMVPVELITNIAKLRHGGSYKILSTLLRYKLVAHTNQEYNGYRLSYLGYDILALKSLLSRGVIASVGNQIGVGKESDIFEAEDEHGNEVVIKIHRLGRTSFRAVRRQRDYMQGKSKASWLFMSRLAALKEFAFMKALYAHGFPTPIPIDQNRHVVAMSKVSGCPMCQIRAGGLGDPEHIFNICLGILRRLAEHGLVHCDFNEFNLMVDGTGTVTLIDFPQMVSLSHPNAAELLRRDLSGLIKFFAMKMHFVPPEAAWFELEDVTRGDLRIDEETKASGFSKEEEDDELANYEWNTGGGADREGGDDEEEERQDGHREEDGAGSNVDQVADSVGGLSLTSSALAKNASSGASGPEVDESDGEDEEDGEEGGGDTLAGQVKLKLKSKHDSNIRKTSRNSTKKRNKYGRIVKTDKIDASSGGGW